MTPKFSCLPTKYTLPNVALQCWFSSSLLMKAVVEVVVDLVGDFSPSSVAINSGTRNPMQSDKSYYGEQPGIKLQTAFLAKDKLWWEWKENEGSWPGNVGLRNRRVWEPSGAGRAGNSISAWVCFAFSPFLAKNLQSRVQSKKPHSRRGINL